LEDLLRYRPPQHLHMPAPSRPLVLVVEDEAPIAELIHRHLDAAGFDVQHLTRGDAAEGAVRAMAPAVVVLDVMLPGLNGVDVCRRLRGFSSAPVLMVTSKAAEADRLAGFDAGADDYVCKPFSAAELVARVKALWRRGSPDDGPPADDGSLLQVDTRRQCIRCRGQELDFTPQEYRLLSVMAQHPGRLFSRSQLLDLAYDDAAGVFDRAVDSHVKNIRKKLAALLPEHNLIRSVYGQGYRFEIGPETSREPAPLPGTPGRIARVPVDLKPWLPGFLSSRLEALDEMEAAIAAHPRDDVFRIAHRLAGSFALYGFAEAARSCHRLEHEGAQLPPAELQRRVEDLREQLRQVEVRFVDDQGRELLGAG
jgi:DNA-binding response OmpR family regulator/HPt (histidine-containing phosphotransfer) domain-containing protein